jgi:hypothetical protein
VGQRLRFDAPKQFFTAGQPTDNFGLTTDSPGLCISSKLQKISLKNIPRILIDHGDRKMLAKTKEKDGSKTEGKREKFVELAENRTRNAMKAIRVIGKLGNKAAYQFDDSDVQKIVRALTREIEALKLRMSSTGGKENVDFKL